MRAIAAFPYLQVIHFTFEFNHERRMVVVKR